MSTVKKENKVLATEGRKKARAHSLDTLDKNLAKRNVDQGLGSALW